MPTYKNKDQNHFTEQNPEGKMLITRILEHFKIKSNYKLPEIFKNITRWFKTPNKKNMIISLGLLVILIASGVAVYLNSTKKEVKAKPLSFNECVSLKGEVEETFPRTCSLAGKVYEDIDGKELATTRINYWLNNGNDAQDDGVRQYMDSKYCGIRVSYERNAVNFAKIYKNTTEIQNNDKEKSNLDPKTKNEVGNIFGTAGFRLLTPNDGSIQLGCVEKSIDLLAGKNNIKKVDIKEIPGLRGDIRAKILPDSAYTDSHYSSGQKDWYFSTSSKNYILSDWRNFVDKLNAEVTVI